VKGKEKRGGKRRERGVEGSRLALVWDPEWLIRPDNYPFLLIVKT